MRQSTLFTKTRREAPKDEEAVNAKLLIRAGFVDKLMAGVYTFLPLGFRVLKKIENIVREEINKADGVEILMPTLQPKENWQKTGRWDTMDDLYKVKDKSEKEFALGPTHEEVIFPLLKKYIFSYKDLPLYIYQIQNKFRMELRAKSGLLRGREFLMKDLYSFHTNEEDRDKYYDKIIEVYKTIFDKVGIGEKTYFTLAPGGTFSRHSHEFQTITEAGEDIIHICEACKIAINDEIIKEQKSCPKCGKNKFQKEKSVETGNIFKLKDKFAEDFDLKFRDKDGSEKFVSTGCYGLGFGRLIGVVVEVNHDDKGIIWPESIAPFQVHLLDIRGKGQEERGKKIYETLQKNGVEVLYDDRNDASAGEKFADADLIGIPYRAVISEKTGDKIEIKKRSGKEIKLVSEKELIKSLI
ncbi:MAG: aminoacyl--tRNA ligase-related protein [Patescibacteria group bacterium]